jgi:hypothetical protein
VRRRTFLGSAVGLFAALVVPRVVRSEDYLSVEQAQALLFPGQSLRRLAVRLTPEQKKAIEKASGERVRKPELEVWRSADGGWFLVDEVIGKHEFITWAIALDAAGAVLGLEVLSYRETYGYEIRRPEWRAQFHGKTAAAPVKIDEDIQNISGATLSCVHITDGVRRILQTHALVLRGLDGAS